MRQWNVNKFFVPWISLWLIFWGMHAAICSILAEKIYLKEVWLLYGIIALLIVILAVLPRRQMIVALFGVGAGIVYWCHRSAGRLLSDWYIMVYYINQRSSEYIHQNLIAEKWSHKGTLAHSSLLLFICILLGMFIAFSFFRYFNRFYGVLPIFLIYCGGLMLGKTPAVAATALLFTGMALAFMWVAEQQGSMGFAGQEKISPGDLVKRYLLTLAVLSVGLSGAVYCIQHFQEPVFKNVEKIQRKQHTMELTLQKKTGDLLQYVRGVLGLHGGGELSNSKPYYTDRVVMKVTVKQKPSQNIYLRGYVGDIYHRGRWKASDQMGDIGAKDGNGRKNVWKGQYLDQYDLYGDLEEEDIEIQYKKKFQQRYLPYRMPKEEEELTEQEQKICRGEKDDELGLYEDLAEQMEEEGFGTEWVETDDVDVQMLSEEDGSWYSADSYNDEISRAVYGVQWTLRKNAEYSLVLDPLPYDRDYAEYFLFVSGKGYCEHFATAGTLLLRQLGVCSRYVTGFCISADQFSENKNGTYTAEVLDSDAHAWCEVWAEGLWMPQEMTPGEQQDHAMEGTADEEEALESIENTNEIAKKEDFSRDDSEVPAEEKKEEARESATVKPTATALPEENTGGALGNGSKEGKFVQEGFVSRYRSLPLAIQILLPVLLLSVIAAGSIWMLICRRKRNRERRLLQMRRRNPEKYVGMRLALLLKRMKREGIPIRIEMSEKEWLGILREHCQEQFSSEEAERLLDLARRAAFSEERISEDELWWLDQLCRQLEMVAADAAS